ncbi:MAG: MFS transporter [Deltaproteobacteria bacterium]|jgi:NNP family nitrate/nitrite transporter-like MFS transporter|nr:MFS transporter [Deltaproteobacteria bacterium]
MADNNSNSFRYIIVAVVALAAFVINFIHFQVAGLAPMIMQVAKAAPEQFGLLMGMPLLAACVLGIPSGALGDRYGVKPVVAIALVVSLIGVIGRYASEPTVSNYVLWMFLVGVSNAALNANFIKVLGMWLPPTQIGLGVGCYLAGIGLGQSGAVAVGSRFASLTSAFMVSIWVTVAALIIWFIIIRTPQAAGGPPMKPKPLLESLKYVMAKPAIWVGALCALFMLGSYVTLNSFWVNSLITVKGVSPETAGMTGSVVAFSLMIGSLVSAVIVKITGRSRVFLLVSGLISAICTYLSWNLEYSGMTVVYLFGVGFFSGAYLSFVLSLPMLLDYVGPVYAGSAGGVISTLQSGGGFALPFLVPMMAKGEPTGIFNLVAVGFGLMAIIALLLPELVAVKKK